MGLEEVQNFVMVKGRHDDEDPWRSMIVQIGKCQDRRAAGNAGMAVSTLAAQRNASRAADSRQWRDLKEWPSQTKNRDTKHNSNSATGRFCCSPSPTGGVAWEESSVF